MMPDDDDALQTGETDIDQGAEDAPEIDPIRDEDMDQGGGNGEEDDLEEDQPEEDDEDQTTKKSVTVTEGKENVKFDETKEIEDSASFSSFVDPKKKSSAMQRKFRKSGIKAKVISRLSSEEESKWSSELKVSVTNSMFSKEAHYFIAIQIGKKKVRTSVSKSSSKTPTFSDCDYTFKLGGSLRHHQVQVGAFVVVGRSDDGSSKGTPKLLGTARLSLNDISDPINIGNSVTRNIFFSRHAGISKKGKVRVGSAKVTFCRIGKAFGKDHPTDFCEGLTKNVKSTEKSLLQLILRGATSLPSIPDGAKDEGMDLRLEVSLHQKDEAKQNDKTNEAKSDEVKQNDKTNEAKSDEVKQNDKTDEAKSDEVKQNDKTSEEDDKKEDEKKEDEKKEDEEKEDEKKEDEKKEDEKKEDEKKEDEKIEDKTKKDITTYERIIYSESAEWMPLKSLDIDADNPNSEVKNDQGTVKWNQLLRFQVVNDQVLAFRIMCRTKSSEDSEKWTPLGGADAVTAEISTNDLRFGHEYNLKLQMCRETNQTNADGDVEDANPSMAWLHLSMHRNRCQSDDMQYMSRIRDAGKPGECQERLKVEIGKLSEVLKFDRLAIFAQLLRHDIAEKYTGNIGDKGKPLPKWPGANCAALGEENKTGVDTSCLQHNKTDCKEMQSMGRALPEAQKYTIENNTVMDWNSVVYFDWGIFLRDSPESKVETYPTTAFSDKSSHASSVLLELYTWRDPGGDTVTGERMGITGGYDFVGFCMFKLNQQQGSTGRWIDVDQSPVLLVNGLNRALKPTGTLSVRTQITNAAILYRFAKLTQDNDMSVIQGLSSAAKSRWLTAASGVYASRGIQHGVYANMSSAEAMKKAMKEMPPEYRMLFKKLKRTGEEMIRRTEEEASKLRVETLEKHTRTMNKVTNASDDLQERMSELLTATKHQTEEHQAQTDQLLNLCQRQKTQILSAEGRNKQKQTLIDKLMKEVERRADAIRSCGVEIVRLRKAFRLKEEENKKLTTQINHREDEDDDIVNTLIEDINNNGNSSNTNLFEKKISVCNLHPENAIHYARVIARKYDGSQKMNLDLTRRLHMMQKGLLKTKGVKGRLIELEGAQSEAQHCIQRLQHDNSKVKILRNTVTQEKVISKLQKIIEKRIKNTAMIHPPTVPDDNVSPSELSKNWSNALKKIDSKVMEQGADDVDGVSGNIVNPSGNASIEVEHLNAQLKAKDDRISVLEDQMTKTAEEAAEELAELKLQIMELQMGGGGSSSSDDESF